MPENRVFNTDQPFHVLLVHEEASTMELTPKSYDLGIFTLSTFLPFTERFNWAAQLPPETMPNVISAWQSDEYRLLCLPMKDEEPAAWYMGGEFHVIPQAEDPRH